MDLGVSLTSQSNLLGKTQAEEILSQKTSWAVPEEPELKLTPGLHTHARIHTDMSINAV